MRGNGIDAPQTWWAWWLWWACCWGLWELRAFREERFISAELEFWLGLFLYAANPQGLKVALLLPQLGALVAVKSASNNGFGAR